MGSINSIGDLIAVINWVNWEQDRPVTPEVAVISLYCPGTSYGHPTGLSYTYL